MSHLQSTSYDELKSARLVLLEMQEAEFPEGLIETLRKKSGVSIKMDPSLAYERAPLEFYVSFQKSALNTSAAREEISVHWDFGDSLKVEGLTVSQTVSHYFQITPKIDTDKEKGRTVSRYFQRHFKIGPKIDTYKVQAQFYDQTGKMVVDSNGKPDPLDLDVKINPSETGRVFGERTVTEYLKLTAALLIAVLGLVSGTQEQIAKLDILPGMVAIFLLGFSADSISRLLTGTKT